MVGPAMHSVCTHSVVLDFVVWVPLKILRNLLKVYVVFLFSESEVCARQPTCRAHCDLWCDFSRAQERSNQNNKTQWVQGQALCASRPASQLSADMETSNPNFDFRGVDRKCRCAAIMSLFKNIINLYHNSIILVLVLYFGNATHRLTSGSMGWTGSRVSSLETWAVHWKWRGQPKRTRSCARSMRALSSQPLRFLNNLCAFVCCLSVCLFAKKPANTRSLVHPAS